MSTETNAQLVIRDSCKSHQIEVDWIYRVAFLVLKTISDSHVTSYPNPTWINIAPSRQDVSLQDSLFPAPASISSKVIPVAFCQFRGDVKKERIIWSWMTLLYSRISSSDEHFYVMYLSPTKHYTMRNRSIQPNDIFVFDPLTNSLGQIFLTKRSIDSCEIIWNQKEEEERESTFPNYIVTTTANAVAFWLTICNVLRSHLPSILFPLVFVFGVELS